MSTSSTFRDKNSVTTILAVKNQLAATLGIGFDINKNTTINTKRGVLADANPTSIPKIRYFGIGIKGYANLTSADNVARPYNPSSEDCDLYEPIPFRCVRERLTPTEAAPYRICTTWVNSDGVLYYQYWLKKIEFQSNIVNTTKLVNGVESTYDMTDANMTPVPNDLFPTDLTDTEKRVVASVTGVCRVTGAEVDEVIQAMYGGDLDKARISEFGTYSGCETSLKINGETYAEAVYVQLCTHKCTTGTAMSKDTILTEMKTFENSSCVII